MDEFKKTNLTPYSSEWSDTDKSDALAIHNKRKVEVTRVSSTEETILAQKPLFKDHIYEITFTCRESTHIKLGVTSSRALLNTCFSNFETGWSLFLDPGQGRHASSSQGPDIIPRQLIARAGKRKNKVVMIVDRLKGAISFYMKGMVAPARAFSSAGLRDSSPIYVACSLHTAYSGSVEIELPPSETQMALLFVKKFSQALDAIPNSILREL